MGSFSVIFFLFVIYLEFCFNLVFELGENSMGIKIIEVEDDVGILKSLEINMVYY